MNPPYWKDSEDIDTGFRALATDHAFRSSENDFVVSHVPAQPQNSLGSPQPPAHVTASTSQHAASPTVHSTVSVNALNSQLNPSRLSENSPIEGASEDGVDESLTGTRKKVSSTKRAVQNRNAQRAFRQRREKYLKELEARVGEMLQLHKKIDDLQRENRELRDYTMALQSELLKLTHNVNSDHKG